MIKLNLGSGNKKIKDFLSVDIQNFKNVDIVADISNLPFQEKSIDEIYSCCAIEHFGRNKWKEVLQHWYNLLKDGGVLRLSTADFEACCREYLENKKIESLLGLIVGGQKDHTDWHGMIFDFNLLKQELENIGFKDVKRYNWRDIDFFKKNDYDDYSRSYIPHMDFDNGRLMMLNIECCK